MKVAFLASGGGGTLRFLDQAARRLRLPIEVVGVFADRDCAAAASALQLNIPVGRGHYDRDNSGLLDDWLHSSAADVVITNFHRIIGAGTLACTGARFINLHYSLLPAFAGFIGMRSLAEAKARAARFVGATCHEVDETLDGGPILAQCAFAACWQEQSFEEVQNRLFRSACLCLLGLLAADGKSPPPAVQDVLGQSVTFNPGLNFVPPDLDEAFWSNVAAS